MKEYAQITLLCVTGICVLAMLLWSPPLTDALALALLGHRLLGGWGKLVYAVSLVVLWLPLALAIFIAVILAWKRLFYLPEEPGAKDRGLPGVPASIAAIATTAIFCVLFFPFFWVPFIDHATHATDWPAGLELVSFTATARDPLTGDGELSIELRNRSPVPARDARFTVLTGFTLDERVTPVTFPLIAPGATEKAAIRVQMGDVRARRRHRRGSVDAHARIEWDRVHFDGSSYVPRTQRPSNAKVTVSLPATRR